MGGVSPWDEWALDGVCSLRRRGRASRTPAARCPLWPMASPLCWLQAAALLTALPTPWGQRLGCRADRGQASLAGAGLREETITPASHSSASTSCPERGPGRDRGRQRLCLEGQDQWGLHGKGLGRGGSSHSNLFLAVPWGRVGM